MPDARALRCPTLKCQLFSIHSRRASIKRHERETWSLIQVLETLQNSSVSRSCGITTIDHLAIICQRAEVNSLFRFARASYYLINRCYSLIFVSLSAQLDGHEQREFLGIVRPLTPSAKWPEIRVNSSTLKVHIINARVAQKGKRSPRRLSRAPFAVMKSYRFFPLPQVAQVLHGAHLVDDDRSLRLNIRGAGHMEFRDNTRLCRSGYYNSLLHSAVHGGHETASWRTTKSSLQLGPLVRR